MAAAILAAFFFILIVLCRVDLLPAMPEKGTNLILSGNVNKIEEKGSRVLLFLSHAKTEGRSLGTVILDLSEEQFSASSLRIGNRIQAACYYKGFQKARNQGNFDEENYYRSLGVAGKFRLQKNAAVEITDATYNAGKQWLYVIRRKIRNIFGTILEQDEEKAGLFSAIVLGDRSGVETDVKTLYQKNGIAHILAVSGLHISLIGMGLFRILRKRFYIPASAILSGSIMILFCIMSGGSASAIRATIMFLLRMVAEVRGKTFDLLNALALAAFLLLVSNPMYLTNSAFLLSFGAILGLGLPGNAMERFLVPHWPTPDVVPGTIEEAESRKKDRVEAFAKAFIASLSVFLMTAPILMSVYYEVSLFSVLLNLLVIPMMSFILGSGILGGVSGLLSIALARFSIGLGAFLLSLVEILCLIQESFPFLVLITGAPSVLRIGLFYGLLIGGTAFLERYARREWEREQKGNLFRKGLVCGTWVLLLLLVLFLHLPDRQLKISFLDVDQGDGILLEVPSGEVCLIDGGSSSVSSVGERRMESALKYRRVSVIDYAFVSHTDMDHISGLLELMEESGAGSICIRNLCLPAVSGSPELADDENLQLLLDAAQKKGAVVRFLSAGDRFSFGEVTISCLHPFLGTSYPDANAASCVLRLEYGSFSALFAGDLEKEGEKELLSSGLLSDCDLLKVGHHGSRDASSAASLQRVDPQLAVISAGVNNRYGHPHVETLERLKACGARIFVTAERGQITFRIDRRGKIAVFTMF